MDKIKSRCGVVTFHSSHNYGSVLQAYALIKVLQGMELDAEIIDYRHPYTTDMYEWKLWSPYKSLQRNFIDIIIRGILRFGREREKQFRQFINSELPKSERFYHRSEIPDNKYDILICGSDQIWNPYASGRNDPIYFLDFGSAKCRFSYAASSGSFLHPFAEGCHERIQGYLERFRSIGVREKSMQNYIREEFGLNSTVNPDPTLLLPLDEWTKLEVEYNGLPSKYVLVYSLWEHKSILKFAYEVSQELHLPLVYLCTSFRFAYHKGIEYCLTNVSPQQFLWLFHHASFIITNTFHGNMFSVIYRKNFINHTVGDCEDTRMKTLHDALGLHGRIISDIKTFRAMEKIIDYSAIETSLYDFRKKGLFFIKENIAYGSE